MKFKKIYVLGILLVATVLFLSLVNSYASSNPKYIYGGTYSTFTSPVLEWDSSMCQEGQDFILQIDAVGCTPTVVRSDLLEEQDVNVFCPIRATKINPLIDVKTIDGISFGGSYPKEVRTIGFQPARSALGSGIGNLFGASFFKVENPTYENIGYIVISLKQNEIESSMPDFVEGTINATIRYDIENAFGIRKNVYYLPQLDYDDWDDVKNQYSFWDRRGYLALENVDEDSATIILYSDVYRGPIEGRIDEKRKFGSITLKEGETSSMLYLPGFYCFAGLRLKLEEVVHVNTRAVLKIGSEYYELQEGERFLDNRCKIKNNGITKQGINQKVEIYCQEDDSEFLGFGGDFEISLKPRLKLKVGTEEKIVEVGDYLGSSNTGEMDLFLGYAKIIGNTNKERDLKAYIYTTPFTGEKRNLTEDELSYVANWAEGIETETDSGTPFLERAKEFGEYAYAEAKGVYGGVVKGKGLEDLFINVEENIKDIDITLLGFVNGGDLELNSAIYDNYDGAEWNYDRVINDYPNEVFDSLDLSLESFIKKIKLAKYLGQNIKLSQLCEEYKELYSGWPITECEKDISIYGESVSYTVLIDGEIKEISLYKINEPNYNNYGVELFVKDTSSLGEYAKTFKLTKDQRVYLNKDTGEYVELVGLEEDYATIKIYTQNKSLYQQAEGFFTNEETLRKNIPKSLGSDYVFTVKKINLENYAKVKLIPEMHYQRSEADFKFRINIEKRAIQLAPEKIKSKVDKLNKQIEDWNKISDSLGKVVKGMKTACLGAGAVLTVKNLIQNSDGKSIARQEVMRSSGGWYEKCAKMVSNGTYGSQEDCYFDHANDIDEEVSLLYQAMKSQNEVIKEIQKNHYLENQFDFLGDKNVDTEAFVEDYVKEIVKNFSSGSIENPKKLGEYILYADVTTILTGENNFKNGYYDIDELKEIDLYHSLYQSTEDVKYQQKLYDVVFEMKEDSDDLLQLNNAIKGSGISLEDFEFLNINEESVEKVYKGKKLKDYQSIPNPYGLNKKTTPVQAIQTNRDEYYLFVLDGSSEIGEYPIKRMVDDQGNETLLIYDVRGNLENDPAKIEELRKFHFKVYDSSSYENKFISSFGEKEPVLRYYESEPYKGLPAVVPFDLKNGWYVYIKQNLPVFGTIGSYDLSGKISSFYLCNVGENGLEENMKNPDDICELINLGTGQPYNQFPGLDEDESKRIVSCATSAIESASRISESKRTGNVRINAGKCGIIKVRVGNPATDIPATECADFMSPKDCKLLFNLCDPVICPSSRCDFGGAYPVKDVIQSGVIGSVALCLPNIKEGIYIPVCLTGVKAGLDGWLSVISSYRDCLQQSLETGETVGICDEIHSIYMCEFFWRQAFPIAKLAVPKLLGFVLGQNSRGGGEYMGVQSAWENAQDSITYFTQYYAADSYRAFQYRNSEQIGTEVCKNFISVTYPGGVSILDSLTEPDSPPQFNGKFDEIPFSTVTNPPTSHYKVFYHIYAGNDRGAYYRVYLREGSQGSYYQDNFFGRIVASGYIPKGDYATKTVDFTAPSGFKELCINVNGQEECGFAQVSTSFAIDYVKDQYIKQQSLQTDIKTEKECISGSASLYNLLDPNLQQAGENLMDPQIYNRGILRICASENPGSGSNPDRWTEVGYCGDKNMKCWIDEKSIKKAVEFSHTANQTIEELNDYFMNKFVLGNESEFVQEGEFSHFLKILDDESDPIKRINMIDEILGKVYFNNQKAYLHLLKGDAYGWIAKSLFSEYSRFLDDERKKEEERKKKEKQKEQDEVREEVLKETDARKRVLKVVGALNGESAEKGTVVKDCDINGNINCFDAVLHIYNFAEVDKRCVYSDKDGKTYSLDNGRTIFTSAKENSLFQVNPTKCLIVDKSEKEKLNGINPGDILSIYYKFDENRDWPHNVIFIDWVGDNDLMVARVFDWNGVDKNGNKIFQYSNMDLSDAKHPVYMYWKPVINGAISGEPGSEENLQEAIENLVNEKVSAKFEIGKVCYKFFEGEWHWTKNCNTVGTVKIQTDPELGIVVNSYKIEWLDTDKFENPYGRDPNRESSNTILLLQNADDYNEGLQILIESAKDLGKSLKTSNTKMRDNLVFEVEGFYSFNKIYFDYSETDNNWVWRKSRIAERISVTAPNRVKNSLEFSKREKAVMKHLDGMSFIEGAKFLFSLNLKGLPNVISDENYYSFEWTLKLALTEIRNLSGTYGSNLKNKEFIDEICLPGLTGSSNYILTSQQCKDIKGEDSNGFTTFFNFNGENNFDDVKEMLIQRDYARNGNKWSVESALLKLDLMEEGDYFDLNREGMSLETLRSDSILSSYKYEELKIKGTSGENIVPDLIVYFENQISSQEVLQNQGPINLKWDFDSAIDRAKFLEGKYNDEDRPINKEFIDEICDEELLSEENCSYVKGEVVFGGWFNREKDIPTEVRGILIDNKGENRKYYGSLISLSPWDWHSMFWIIKKDWGLVNNGNEYYAPLHYTAQHKDFETVKFLVEKGANVNLEKFEGKPLSYAQKNTGLDKQRIIDYLIENGAIG